MLIHGSLFAGIGGFDLGLGRSGIETVWQVEIDSACREVLTMHWPRAERFEDVKNCGRHNLQPVDVITGGFPCQDLSVAGRRAGLAGERSGLWFEFHRILEELRPSWVVVENVPGLLSSNGGRDFAIVLSGLVKIGYGVCWRIFDAQYFGVAQLRRRVFIVGSLGSGCSAEVLFEPEGLSRNSPPSRKKEQEVAAPITPRLGGSGQGWPRWNESEGLVPAITHPITSKNQQLDPTEETLIPMTFKDREGCEGGGKGLLTKEGQSFALSASQDQKVMVFSRGNLTREGGANPSDKVPTLRQDMGDHFPCVAFNWQSGGGVWLGIGKPNLQASQVPAVFSDKAACIYSAYGTKWNGNRAAESGGLFAQGHYGIRRLTPTECERLQGFPDGWTLGHSDTTRYKMLGNAVCVNVAEWIGERLVSASGI